MNTITCDKNYTKPVAVEDVPAGTYVRGLGELKDNIYLVLVFKNNPAGIAAINIETGVYITGESKVIPLPPNTRLISIVNTETL
jgi:hypothetical protein